MALVRRWAEVIRRSLLDRLAPTRTTGRPSGAFFLPARRKKPSAAETKTPRVFQSDTFRALARDPSPKPTGPGAARTGSNRAPWTTCPRSSDLEELPSLKDPRTSSKWKSNEKKYQSLVGHYFSLPPGQMDVKNDFRAPVQNRAPWTAAPQ